MICSMISWHRDGSLLVQMNSDDIDRKRSCDLHAHAAAADFLASVTSWDGASLHVATVDQRLLDLVHWELFLHAVVQRSLLERLGIPSERFLAQIEIKRCGPHLPFTSFR